MIVYYGYTTKLKINGVYGETQCPNCNHRTQISLGHEKTTINMFFIPIFAFTRKRVKICSNCGIVEELNKKEYKLEKNKFPKK